MAHLAAVYSAMTLGERKEMAERLGAMARSPGRIAADDVCAWVQACGKESTETPSDVVSNQIETTG